jgi:HK97 family phage portal protein
MGFRDRLNVAAWALFGLKGITGLDVLLGADARAWYPSTDFNRLSAEGYEYNAVIYACITALMDAMEEAPLMVEVQDRNGEWQEKPDHALARLLQKPNPEMGEDDLQSISTMYQKLAGNAFWEKERSQAERVMGLWPMRPDHVGIVAVKAIPGQRVKRRIEGYTWRSGTDVVNLPPGDVIHFKEHHPRDELYGLPPLAAGAREGDTDNRATNYVGSFFDNAAVPKGLMKVQERIDDAEEKRIKDRLRQMFTGRGGWHEPMILGEGTEWVELAETFADMDFPNLRKITETRLCAVFKVPPIVAGTYAGLEQATYANYSEARKAFMQTTIIPMYRRFDTVLNRTLAPEFGDNVRVRSDTSQLAALAEDRTGVWARATAAFTAGAITVNDFRAEVGLERVEDGDIFLRGMMLREMPGELETQKILMPIREVKALPPSPEELLERRYKAFDMVARAWEGRFRKEAQEQFKRELEEVLAILRREGKASKQGLPFAGFLDGTLAFLVTSRPAWQAAFLPLFTGLMQSQTEEVLGALGFSFDVSRPEVQQFLENYTIHFTNVVADATAHSVTELVAQAQAEGWSVPHLREEITARYTEFDERRADMIARTETIRSSNAGTREAWRLAGVERLQWYAHVDGRECEFCGEMHDRYGPGTDGISITENFVNEGGEVSTQTEEGTTRSMTVTYGDVANPPLHVNCRCTILAVSQ